MVVRTRKTRLLDQTIGCCFIGQVMRNRKNNVNGMKGGRDHDDDDDVEKMARRRRLEEGPVQLVGPFSLGLKRMKYTFIL